MGRIATLAGRWETKLARGAVGAAPGGAAGLPDGGTALVSSSSQTERHRASEGPCRASWRSAAEVCLDASMGYWPTPGKMGKMTS